MAFFAFLNIQLHLYLRRGRWLLPLPIGALLGYWAVQVVRVLNALSPANPDASANGNALEAFLWAFGKPEIVYFVAGALYLYLVADFAPARSFEQAALLRLRSRSAAWFARVALLLLATLAYSLLLFGSFCAVVATWLPFSTEWSPAGLNNFGMGLGYSLQNGGPLPGALSVAGFLLAGWFGLGLLALTVNQLARRAWPGFLCGALTLVTADLGSLFGGPIGGQGWLSYLLLQNHFEYTPLWAPSRVIPVAASWIFWCAWVGGCILAGWLISRRADVVAVEH